MRIQGAILFKVASMLQYRLLLMLAVGHLMVLATVRAAPSCRVNIGFTHNYYVCANFTSISDFALVDRSRMPTDAYFILKDSTFDHLPSTAFAGTAISVLEFKNVSVNTYGDPSENARSPFEPINSTLRRLIFTRQQKAVESWSLLHCLKRLESLRVDNVGRVSLTSDFNKLPLTITEIRIERSSVETVDQDWLSELRGLKSIAVKGTNITSITRSMLPRPALKLNELDVSENELTSLPEDLTADMPSLRTLDVSHNKISTLYESTLEPVMSNGGIVHMMGNPLRCDCRLAFLLTYPKKWNYYLCAHPAALVTKSIRTLKMADLCRVPFRRI